jgi:tetratricopeptide (TPR) repeat protein
VAVALTVMVASFRDGVARWLDQVLFGDLALLHHLHSLALFGLLLGLLWRLYGRLGLNPTARWLALALFAADESTVMPVAWLANRNSLLEALCAAGALLCPTGQPTRPLAALLLAALAAPEPKAVATAGDNAFTHFNAGLLYLELNEFEKALQQAHRANELGMVNPALRERLQAAGKWQEPTSPPADAARAPDPTASTADHSTRP